MVESDFSDSDFVLSSAEESATDDDSEQLSEASHIEFSDDSDFEEPAPITRRGSKRMRLSASNSAETSVVESVPTPKPKRKRKKKVEDEDESSVTLSRDEKFMLKVEKFHPECALNWEEIELENKNRIPKADHIPGIVNVKLLPFQKEGFLKIAQRRSYLTGVSWCLSQEEGPFNGGLIADEMGMGKTIQMISVMVSKPLKKPSLVISPVVALIQWKEEIEKYTLPGTLKVAMFHGESRAKEKKVLLQHDVILTSYAVVESCWRKERTGFKRKGATVKEPSLIHNMDWGRLVLDEAHNIKDRSCSTARAVFAIKSDKKWSLSGTPLQNRVGDLYSLIRLLRVAPYSYYYCGQCDCKSLTWDFSDYKSCDHCSHKPMQHFCWWNKVIMKPIQKYGGQGEGKIAFERLSVLLDQMMLRRTKLERAEDLGLPPKHVEVRRIYMSEQEEDFYAALYSETRTQFASYVRQGTVLNNYAHIFELLSKLRQAADHPFLVVHKRSSKENPGSYVCGLCHDVAEDPIASRCKHVFCREDIRQYIESYIAKDPSTCTCPICFSKLSLNVDQEALAPPSFGDDKQKNIGIIERMLNAHENDQPSSSKSNSDNVEWAENGLPPPKWTSSTKIEAILQELHVSLNQTTPLKTLIFSQFTQFLDLVHWRLLNAGIGTVKLDGRMGKEARDAVVKAFQRNSNVSVMLVSLKAGGVALNLTEASRVILVDPWWNPATEDQAMDRIHRLGQHRPVKIVRLIVENSIESRILDLQIKKQLLFQSTVGKSQAALDRLTEEDLRFLFQM